MMGNGRRVGAFDIGSDLALNPVYAKCIISVYQTAQIESDLFANMTQPV